MMLQHVWNGVSIEQQEDGYVCLTDIAFSEQTDVAQYLRTKSSQAYIEALAEDLNVPASTLVYSVGTGRYSKTWAHLEIAIDMAHWVSVPFRIWANRVLREVIVNAGYVREDATQEQLEVLQAKIEVLQQENKFLADNRQLTGIVRDFMDCCFEFAPGKHVLSSEWQQVFVKWVKKKYPNALDGLNISAKEIVVEMDRLLKSRPEPKQKRMYIDLDNGYGDLENAKLLPVNTRQLRSEFAVLAGYSHDIRE